MVVVLRTFPAQGDERVHFQDYPIQYRKGWSEAPFDSRMLHVPFGGDPITWDRDEAANLGWSDAQTDGDSWELSPYVSPVPWGYSQIGGGWPNTAVYIDQPNQYNTYEGDRVNLQFGDVNRSEWKTPANQPGGGGANLVGDGFWISVSGKVISHIGPSDDCYKGYKDGGSLLTTQCSFPLTNLPVVRDISLDEHGHVRWWIGDGFICTCSGLSIGNYRMKCGPRASSIIYDSGGSCSCSDIPCFCDYIPTGTPS